MITRQFYPFIKADSVTEHERTEERTKEEMPNHFFFMELNL